MEHHYVTLKRSNPDFPFLIRECSGVQARVWARYGGSGANLEPGEPSHSVTTNDVIKCSSLFLQILGRRKVFQWKTCQLTRWPQLFRPWSSPNPEHPHVLWLVQPSLIVCVCKFVDMNKRQYEYTTLSPEYLLNIYQ